MDNELEKKLQQAFDKFERDGTVDSDDPITTMFVKHREKQKNSEWEYDAYMDQPAEGLVLQERVTYRRRKDGKIERETIVRRFYGNNDYQDSTTTEIL